MPEESFEQQARNMAEQFSMEPQPVVWQRVKAAIAPKRRRRAAFIWWILAVGVVCGLGFWLMNDSKLPQNKESNGKQNLAAKTNSNTTEKFEKGNENAHPNLATHPTINNKQNNASVDKKDAAFFVQNNQSGNERKRVKKRADATLFQTKTYFAPDENVAKEKEAKTKIESTPIPSQRDVLANNNAVADLKNKSLQNAQATGSDTAKAIAKNDAKPNDTLNKNKDSALASINKKKGKNKWHWGITAEGGTSWLGNGLFGDGAKSLSYVFSGPTVNQSGSSPSISTFQQRKNGIDVALGAAVTTNLSKHWFLDGALTCRYQQFSIQTTTFSSLSAALNDNVSKTNSSYRFQSANLYAGIGLFLFHKKNTSVSLQAGIDNGWLLSIKQKHNDSLQSISTL